MGPPSIRQPRLFERLQPARRVLLAGAGGGFDVYATLPLALALLGAGPRSSSPTSPSPSSRAPTPAG